MNNAPFRVGQRVVCVKSAKTNWMGVVFSVIKDRNYTIQEIDVCCGTTWISVGTKNPFGGSRCAKCGRGSYDGHYYFNSAYFAPIAPRSIEISESLKEQAEEMKDLAETIAPMKKELV